MSAVGAAAVTLQKVAARAKVPFPTAHYHFGGDRNELIEAGIQYISRQAAQFTMEHLSRRIAAGEPALDAYINVTFDWIDTHVSEARVWLYSYYSASISKSAKTTLSETMMRAKQRLLQLLLEERGRASSPLGTPPSADFVSEVYSMMLGYGIQQVAVGDADARKKCLIGARKLNHA